MKKALLVSMALFITIPFYSIAQDIPQKVHEAGINFSSLNNFGIRYKCGTDNTLLRLTLLSINGNNTATKLDSVTNNQSSMGFGFNIGFEKRKMINEKFDFYYGLDLLSTYTYNKTVNNQFKTSSENSSFSPGLGFVLGLRYKINSAFNITAEVIPSVKYSSGKITNTNNSVNSTQTTSGYSFGLLNSNASLTLAYRFGK